MIRGQSPNYGDYDDCYQNPNMSRRYTAAQQQQSPVQKVPPTITNTPRGLTISGPINFRSNADILLYQDAPLPPVPDDPPSLNSSPTLSSPQAPATPHFSQGSPALRSESPQHHPIINCYPQQVYPQGEPQYFPNNQNYSLQNDPLQHYPSSQYPGRQQGGGYQRESSYQREVQSQRDHVQNYPPRQMQGNFRDVIQSYHEGAQNCGQQYAPQGYALNIQNYPPQNYPLQNNYSPQNYASMGYPPNGAPYHLPGTPAPGVHPQSMAKPRAIQQQPPSGIAPPRLAHPSISTGIKSFHSPFSISTSSSSDTPDEQEKQRRQQQPELSPPRVASAMDMVSSLPMAAPPAAPRPPLRERRGTAGSSAAEGFAEYPSYSQRDGEKSIYMPSCATDYNVNGYSSNSTYSNGYASVAPTPENHGQQNGTSPVRADGQQEESEQLQQEIPASSPQPKLTSSNSSPAMATLAGQTVSPYVKQLTSAAPPATAPPTPPVTIPPPVKAEEIATLVYIDLSASASTVQMIKSTGRLPRWLQKCASLEYLVAKNLRITVIDEWVSEKLTNLKVIRLNDNQISTWPDHLVRLLPHNLLFVDLDGNPCMNNMFKKSAGFKAMYEAAATGADISKAIVASSSKNYHVAGSETLAKEKSSGGGLFKRSKFKKREISVPEEASNVSDDDDDEEDTLTCLEPTAVPTNMLRKQASGNNLFTNFSKYRNNSSPAVTTAVSPPSQQQSSAASVSTPTLNASASAFMADLPDMERMKSSLSNSAPEKWTNKRIEPSEFQRAKIVFRLLLDIYELCTNLRITPLDKDDSKSDAVSNLITRRIGKDTPSVITVTADTIISESETTSGSTSLSLISQSTGLASDSEGAKYPGHQRFNSLDVLQHYLDETDMLGSNAEKDKVRHSRIEFPSTDELSSTDVTNLLQSLRDSESEFADLLVECEKIYLNSNNRIAKRAQKVFQWVPEVLNFHTSSLLPILNLAVVRSKKNMDPQLEDFCRSLTRLHQEMHRIYIDYALVIEGHKRQIQFWLQLRPSSASPMAFYGGTFMSYVPEAHPDCEIGDWIRISQRRKEHSLSTAIDYLNLPLERLQDYLDFLQKAASIYPNVQKTLISFDKLITDVERRRPLLFRTRRIEDLQKLFKLKPDQHGNYICDAGVTIHGQVFLEESSVRANLDCLARRSTGKPTSMSTVQVVYNPHKAPKRTLVHLIVCEDVLIVVDEIKRSVLNIVPRKQVTASVPWKFAANGEETSADGGTIASSQTSGSGSDQSSVMGRNTAESMANRVRRGLDNGIRILFHDSLESWYCVIRLFSGDVRGTYQQNCRAIVDAINS